METWSLILALMGAFGLGTLLSNIIDKILGYNLQKKKFQFEKLYIERAQVIKDTYQKMVEMYRAFESLMALFQFADGLTKEEKTNNAQGLGKDFIEYFDNNRIYFDEDIEERIDIFSQKMKSAWIKFNYATMKGGGKQDIEEWKKAWEIIKEEVPIIRKEIERKFRKEIGIKSKGII